MLLSKNTSLGPDVENSTSLYTDVKLNLRDRVFGEVEKNILSSQSRLRPSKLCAPFWRRCYWEELILLPCWICFFNFNLCFLLLLLF